MLDKTRFAPKPPPEPVNTGSLAPGPKKRGRKRTKKQYFTADTDLAIKEYLASSNQSERDEIFKSDDEVGWFWEELKKIQDALNEFTIK